MRKIDKSEVFCTAFNKSLEVYVQSKGKHPDYRNSNFRENYYDDVKFQLLYWQKGLCAYTEDLIDGFIWKEVSSKFINGKYKGDKIAMDGEIDHFDTSQKELNGWDLNNLFLIKKHINSSSVKGSKKTYPFMRPDFPEYSPEKYLEYDFLTHRFLPKTQLENSDLSSKIEDMIVILGLNNHTIKEHRKSYLNQLAWEISTCLKSYEEIIPDRFITAFKMSKDELS
jgi:hypothetical protein